MSLLSSITFDTLCTWSNKYMLGFCCCCCFWTVTTRFWVTVTLFGISFPTNKICLAYAVTISAFEGKNDFFFLTASSKFWTFSNLQCHLLSDHWKFERWRLQPKFVKITWKHFWNGNNCKCSKTTKLFCKNLILNILNLYLLKYFEKFLKMRFCEQQTLSRLSFSFFFSPVLVVE